MFHYILLTSNHRIIASKVFGEGSGVSNSEIDKALRMHISSKNMKDKQRLEAVETVIERLKHKLSMLQDTKNEYIHLICRLEQSLQMDLVHARAKQQLTRMEISDDDETARNSMDATITDIEELEKEVNEKVRSFELLKFSNERLQNEIDELKDKLTSKQRNIAETMIEMKTRGE